MKIIQGIPIKYDYYLSGCSTWKIIFDQLLDVTTKTIVDVSAGWAPKMVMALSQTKFNGTYVALDQSSLALSTLRMMVDPLALNFKVETNSTYQNNNIKNVDVLVFNHCLDDFILYALAPKLGYDAEQLFTRPSDLLQIWDQIYGDKLDEAIEISSNVLVSYVARLVRKNTIIVITQYPGYQEQLMNNQSSIAISRLAFQKVCDLLRMQYKVEVRKIMLPKNSYFNQEDIFCATLIKRNH